MKIYLLSLIVILLILLIWVIGLIIGLEREKRDKRDEMRLVGKRIRGTSFVAKGLLQEHAENSK